MTRERYVIATRRKNKKGVFVDMHIYRPARDFQRTLAGTDPTAPAYQRSLIRAQDDYARFCSAGRPKAPLRNAAGSVIDSSTGMAITRPPGGRFEPIAERSVAWLVKLFLISPQVRSNNPKTRERTDYLLGRLCSLPWPKPERPAAVVGEFAAETLRRDVLMQIRERFAHIPPTADKLMKEVSTMYNWGSRTGLISCANPADKIGTLNKSDGHERVTYAEHAMYCRRWPVGTRQRLAFDFTLYSGVRVSDLNEAGPQSNRDGWLYWTEAKGRDSTAHMGRSTANKQREWQLHPELLRSIAATPHGLHHYIVREDGKPYASPARLGRAIERWMRLAGIHKTKKVRGKCTGKTAHGIRKLGATLLADAGADVLTIRDYLGHTSFAEAMVYIRERDKRLAARRAVALMDVVAVAKATA